MTMDTRTMEIKKTQTASSVSTSKDEAAKRFSPAEFIGEVKEEIQKITWTSPEELKVYTQIVVGATFVCGMGIYFMDLIIQGILTGLALAVRLIAG